MIRLSRRVHFSAAHRYVNPDWDDKRNTEVFGLCFTPLGHGHNYILEVMLEGEIDPTTGMVINLSTIDALLKAVVLPLDHHHLNFDVPEFKTMIPTTENIARYCYQKLQKGLPANIKLIRTRIFEDEDLWADYVE